MHSVFLAGGAGGERVVSGLPRLDTAEENQICTRQQKRGVREYETGNADKYGILAERGTGGDQICR
jgi:hypothetical protein